MTNHRVAARYAKSLVDLAVERKELDRIKQDVDTILAMTENRDLKLLLGSPVVKPAQKKSIFKELLDKAEADELTKAFVNIVISKGREGDLVGILEAFNNKYKEINNISTVKLTSAVPLSDETLNQIKQELIKSGKTEQNIDLHTSINKDLLGGFVLEFDGKVYDASVSQRLKEIKKELLKPTVSALSGDGAIV